MGYFPIHIFSFFKKIQENKKYYKKNITVKEDARTLKKRLKIG
jgi:hypothetical protein